MLLKNTLLSKCIIFSSLFIVFIARFLSLEYKSEFYGNENTINGYIEEIKYSNSKISIILKSKEKVIVNYYVNTYNDLNSFLDMYKLGDYISIKGNMSKPISNTNFYMFDYQKYLKYQNIYYIFLAEDIKIINKNNNIFYSIKQKIIEKIKKLKYSYSYVNSFVLGDDSYILEEEKNCYRNIGISHLFAISGMHIGLIISILNLILKKFDKKISFIVIILLIVFYLFLIGFSPTSLRASIQTLYSYVNKKQRYFNKVEIILLVFFTLAIFNPNYIYYMSFQISIVVSFFIALYHKKINNRNKIISLFLLSTISFFSTFPIIIYYFNDINLLSIIVNILLVPLVSYILFPLCIITFLFPAFDYVLFNLFNIFFTISNYIDCIKIFVLSFPNVNIIFYLIYYILIILFYKFKPACIMFTIVALIHYNILYFNNDISLYFFDVGQGDSSLLSFEKGKENIMIDTGGKANYCKSEIGCSKYDLTANLYINFFKKIGIRKLDYLIITHGDFDHMGEAINLVNNFNVKKVIFNCGPYNDLEQELIKVLDKKKILYYSCIKELNIDNNKLYFLQTKEYGNENDNSNVIYTELDGYKFMFMGDASITTEKEIMDNYNLFDIDVLKVGHHGSKTSSSKKFINEINPRYSIISVGKNNRYGHPNKEVLNNLSDSKIYRTDQDGSIMFKIKNNKLKIETCSP